MTWRTVSKGRKKGPDFGHFVIVIHFSLTIYSSLELKEGKIERKKKTVIAKVEQRHSETTYSLSWKGKHNRPLYTISVKTHG